MECANYSIIPSASTTTNNITTVGRIWVDSNVCPSRSYQDCRNYDYKKRRKRQQQQTKTNIPSICCVWIRCICGNNGIVESIIVIFVLCRVQECYKSQHNSKTYSGH